MRRLISTKINGQHQWIGVSMRANETKLYLRKYGTDYEVQAIYKDGVFHVQGDFFLEGKRFKSFKCPKNIKNDVEEYIMTKP